MIKQFETQYGHLNVTNVLSQMKVDLARDQVTVEAMYDEMLRGMVISLNACLNAGDHQQVAYETVRWPADWVQAFKQRWFPRWILRRSPVRMAERTICVKHVTRMCPHLPIPKDRRGSVIDHLTFCNDKDPMEEPE